MEGMTWAHWHNGSVTKYRVLTVCTANVCRSPAAAVMLKTALADAGLEEFVEVASAGTTYESEGFPMDDRTVLALERAGYKVEDHVARTVHVNELATWDLVLTMTANHRDTMKRKIDAIPDDADTPSLHMWGEFDPKKPANATYEELDVHDPWYDKQKVFDRTIVDMERAIPSLMMYLRARLRERGVPGLE